MGTDFPVPTHHPCLHNHRDRHPILRQILLQFLRAQVRPPLALPRKHRPRRRRSASHRCIRRPDEIRDDRDTQGASQDLLFPRNHLLPNHPRRKSHPTQHNKIRLNQIHGLTKRKILFSLLNGKLFSPTRLLTYNDINYGLPSFLTCLEAVTFSLLFHWSYSATEFSSRPHRHLPETLAPRLGTWRAVRDALDLSDVANAVWVALGLAWEAMVRWWKSEGPTAGATKRGPVGKAVGVVTGLLGKKEEKGSRAEDDGFEVSPFDERVAAVPGPALPDPAFGSGPGRTRTFNGHGQDSLWLGTTRGGDVSREYRPLRSNGSRQSSLSD